MSPRESTSGSRFQPEGRIEYNAAFGTCSAGYQIPIVLVVVLVLVIVPLSHAASEDLEHGFAHPPPDARPWVNWFWVDGNVTPEGITADLEAMQRVGLGGALLMDVTQEIPPGPIRFGSPSWHAMFRHAAAEAQRLGLALSMNNAPGWSGSGGPWITPDLAMQKLVWSKTNFEGPVHFEGILPQPPVTLGSYHDVAVVAFPALVGDGAVVPGFSPQVTSSAGQGFDGARLTDQDPTTYVTLPLPLRGKTQYIQLEFVEPFAASHLQLSGGDPSQTFSGVLQVSSDGRQFRDIREFKNRGGNLEIDFEQVSTRYFRILFLAGKSGSGPLRFSGLELVPSFRIELAQAKAGLGRWKNEPPAPANVPSYAVIQPDTVLDLSSKRKEDGSLSFDLPRGLWTVLRFGHTPTGKENHPVAAEASGLECDKLSRPAIEAHFNAFLAGLATSGAGQGPAGFIGTHIDSWENGYQNWTPGFAREFLCRRGYDPARYLPTFTGRIVGSRQVSERFLWDVRRTIADLWADNYAGRLAEISHQHGLQLSIEAYANGPFDQLLYAGRADIPMSEFWAESDDNSRFQTSRSMASAAHIYGKRIIAAEAFTAYPKDAKWQNHPFSLKPLGDAAFCEGVNRIVLHRYAHQPWVDRMPGMTMGQWGVHYERTETWWEQSKPWHEYLARCQFLLQRGVYAADICYLTEEGAFSDPPVPARLQPPPPKGYAYDLANSEVVLTRFAVTDGRLTLPDGMSYRVLVLPGTYTMTPPLLRKIRDLVRDGATVVGPRPTASPSLSDYPQCDAEIQELSGQLWGDCDGKTVRHHAFGKGSILWGDPLADVFAKMGLAPEFEHVSPGSAQPLRAIHQRIGTKDFYFVANSNLYPVTAECRFRVSGRQPEFWYPDRGTISRPASWSENDGRTRLTLKMDPAGSLFVVFPGEPARFSPVTVTTPSASSLPSNDVTLNGDGTIRLLAERPGVYELKRVAGKALKLDVSSLPRRQTISGSWALHFPPGAGAPKEITLSQLMSWSDHGDPGVKYFSGTATYRKTIIIPAELLAEDLNVYLDLGKVCVIAQVAINQRDMGILWKPPFRVEVSKALKPGENDLEIRVVNLWPNRLIGDQQLPEDCEWLPARLDYGNPLKEWPKWLSEGKPSPTGRITFSTWKHWTKDSKLLASGLLGPVTLVPEKVVKPGL